MRVEYEEAWGRGSQTRVHARTLGEEPKQEAGETESKDYFGIGGDKPGQHRRACVRASERERNWAQTKWASAHRKRERSLEAWVIVVVAAIMNLALHKRKHNDNEQRVQVSVFWIILYPRRIVYLNHTLATSHERVESRPTSKRSGGVFRLCFFLHPRDPEAKLQSFPLILFWP